MRKPKYLSFSSLSKFESQIDEFVLTYLCDSKIDREAQGKAAGTGSAFDAYIKAHLYDRYYGAGYQPEKYSFDALFTKQVEPHNRDDALVDGKYVFDCFALSGMFTELTNLLDKAVEPPRFEFNVEENIGGVQLLGKPDGYALLPDNKRVVLDFKVNGFYSKSAVSPTAGYRLCLDGYNFGKPSKSHMATHKNYVPGGYMEDADTAWASQLSTYAWCLGEPVGSEDFTLEIYQCVAKTLPDERPLLRFSHYEGKVRKPFQEHLLKRYQKCWNAIQNEHIFTEMSVEDSRQRFDMLNKQASSMATASPEDKMFNELIRPTFRGF